MSENRRRHVAGPAWNFDKIGSYGVFTAGGSLPIEYLLTSFNASELAKLTFAREVGSGKLDFEMLMQRDMDEDRARTKLSAYLNPKGMQDIVLRAESVFFPPLLIACVPAEHKPDGELEVSEYYPDEAWEEVEKGELHRYWGDVAQLEFYTTDQVSPHKISSIAKNKEATVDISNVRARFKLGHKSEPGARLIAIDGQHRLFALQVLADQNFEAIKDIVVPVCILFSTSATKEYASFLRDERNISAPHNVPQTFRKIFVDVNSKVEAVGAHFTILLNDNDLGSLVVRNFCERVLEMPDHEGKVLGSKALTCVEWNVKSEKDSTIITRDYSITSIGILDKALRECFSSRPDIFNRLLNLEDAKVKKMLVEAADDKDNPSVSWNKFSVDQREIIQGQVREGNSIVDLLCTLFFVSGIYKEAFDDFIEWVEELEALSKENRADSGDYKMAFDTIMNFQTNARKLEARDIISKEGKKRFDWRKQKLTPVMGYALFQRSIIYTLRELLIALPNLPILTIGKAWSALVEKAMSPEIKLFDYTKRYTNNTIWQDAGSIVNREQTRFQMSRLTLGLLGGSFGGEPVAHEITNEMELDDDDEADNVEDRLVELGHSRIDEFWKRYTTDREKQFKKTYRSNLTLEEEEVSRLREAEGEQEDETVRIRKGEIEEGDAQKPFDSAVRVYLNDEFRRAETELRETLGFGSEHIVGLDALDEDELEDF